MEGDAILLNPRVDGPLTNNKQGIVTRIMQQFPGIDRSLIEGLVRLGYSEDEIKAILRALELNASTADIRRQDPKRIPWINRALTAIMQRFKDALNNGQYNALLSANYTPTEIRYILFTNLLPTTQLLVRTESAHDSGEYHRLHQLGYTDVEIRSLIRAGFTVSQLRALANRVNDAQRNGVDAQGLTIQKINDMLFKKRSMNGGMRKSVILYAPGYEKAATASITDHSPKGLGAYVVKSCEQLHEQIRQLGGP